MTPCKIGALAHSCSNSLRQQKNIPGQELNLDLVLKLMKAKEFFIKK